MFKRIRLVLAVAAAMAMMALAAGPASAKVLEVNDAQAGLQTAGEAAPSTNADSLLSGVSSLLSGGNTDDLSGGGGVIIDG